LLVERELVAREREPREKRVLVEQEVADDGAAEHVRLRERLQHARALEEEEELRGERVARHVLVEAGEEGILLRLLEDEVAAEAGGEAPGEARLPRPDGPLDHDVPEPMHGTRSRRRRRCRARPTDSPA